MKRPPFPTKEDLVAGYVAMSRAPQGSPAYEEAFWAHMLMDELVDEFPEEAFEVIKLLLEIEGWEDIVGGVAAGPIEDLLSRHGVEMIEAVEAEARRSPKFNHALGGVWQLNTVDEVWERVEAVRNTVW